MDRPLLQRLTPATRDRSRQYQSPCLINAHINFKTDTSENSILHQLAKKGYTEFVAILLKFGLNIDIKNNKGSTPLHLAAANGHANIVKLLIDHESDIKAVKKYDKRGNTAFHSAAMKGKLGIMKLFIANGAS